MYLNVQNLDSELKLGNENIDFSRTEIAESKINNYESALPIFSELFVQYSNYPELPYYLAMTCNKQKNYKQASKNFQKALDLYPDYHRAKKALINAKERT